MTFYQQFANARIEISADPLTSYSTLLSDLVELIAAGLVEAYFDEHGTVRFRPKKENFR